MRSFKSVLVTGGAGFIGSTLVRKLLDRSDVERLVVLDALTYAGDRRNLAGTDQDPRFHFVEGSINDTELVQRLLKKAGVTGIFHLAAESHVDRSIVDPSSFVHTNVGGTSCLLDCARLAKIPLLICSTDEVYGSAPVHVSFSESGPLNPSSPYSASKAAADLLALAAVTTYQQDLVIARCTNNYGPRQHREKLVPHFIYKALRDEALPLYGSGQQIRDWIHVEDCALGLIAAYERGTRGNIYHIGAGSESTNLGIARRLLKVLHKPEALISHVADRPGHDMRYALNVSRSFQILGWKARIPFRTGFSEVVRELAAALRPTD
ncbi:GDP-mannose 4,6-dehydratase [bacterium]|nr:GDP-mannose 4,6-dehydratase [Akkermansiaceae bacterium]MDA7536785.1 GDP-mannose 4,6-dehydratase [bacterium]MDA7537883.1 GDP-mannose 4,6-dehydratase [Akkermansiaceae bacterium]MDA7649389.1 GDP-mannose 4,6-dehydratase [Akkermansiaceae bacterium]MDA7651271.1 GDP-mannose 4,6-dehydratase [Akkermansiaceae bacterium]